MNLRQLRSLSQIRKLGSFAATGDKIGLSHAAVSLQMQQLEDSLGIALFDRSRRPLVLNSEGARIASIAEDIEEKLLQIRQVASGKEAISSLSIGIIPTCVENLLPRILDRLRDKFPELQVRVKSGLSSELSASIVSRELDYALLTTPTMEIPQIQIKSIAEEPLYVIAPVSHRNALDDSELLRTQPYIAFNKRTWVGQHIAVCLQQRGIHPVESIEIDSLEAIENLVASGFGVSIVPQRLHAAFDNQKLIRIPFGKPPQVRQLALIRHADRRQTQIDKEVSRIFSEVTFVQK